MNSVQNGIYRFSYSAGAAFQKAELLQRPTRNDIGYGFFRNFKRIIFFLLFLTMPKYAQELSKYSDYQITAVNIKDVIIHDNFWLPKIKVVQGITVHYAFDKCDGEGRIENF